MDITSAAIATLISAITSVTITLLLAKLNAKKSLDDQLDGILKIAKLSYPRQSRGFISVSPSKGQKLEAPEGAHLTLQA